MAQQNNQQPQGQRSAPSADVNSTSQKDFTSSSGKQSTGSSQWSDDSTRASQRDLDQTTDKAGQTSRSGMQSDVRSSKK